MFLKIIKYVVVILNLILPAATYADDLCNTFFDKRIFNNNIFGKAHEKISEFSSWPKEIKLSVRYKNNNDYDSLYRNNREQELVIQVPPHISIRLAAAQIANFYQINEQKVYEALQTHPHEEVSISHLLPSFFKKAGANNFCLANCWNTVHRFHGRAFIPMYMTESGAILRLKYFYRPVDLEVEKLKFGDITAVWRRETLHETRFIFSEKSSHMAIYVGGNIVFHKEGPHGTYEFQELRPYGIMDNTRMGYGNLVSIHRKR